MRVHADPGMSVCVHTCDAAYLWSVTRRARVPSAATSVCGAGVSPECYISSATLSIVFLCGCGSRSFSRLWISHKAQRRATVTLSDLWGGAFRPWAGWQHISARSFVQNRRLSTVSFQNTVVCWRWCWIGDPQRHVINTQLRCLLII